MLQKTRSSSADTTSPVATSVMGMLELRFGQYDTDNAGIVTFNELRCGHGREKQTGGTRGWDVWILP